MADELRGGVARREITPNPAMINWIHQEPYDGVLDPLHLRALWLEDDQSAAVVLQWDLIDVWDQAAEQVRVAITAATGVPSDNILIHASHTHSAPRSPFGGREVNANRFARLRPLLDDPVFRVWSAELPAIAAAAAAEAKAGRQPITVGIGRANLGEWLYNRRPIAPDGTVVTTMVPDDPKVLPDGLRFGRIDPTLTVVPLRTAAGPLLATLFHAACHPVMIYPHHRGLSADWPGPVAQWLGSATQSEAIFLQGCAGDIVPARRGLAAREEMSELVIERALAAVANSLVLDSVPLRVGRWEVELPLTPAAAEQYGEPRRRTEVQALLLGRLGLVALPGEPLIGLSDAIRERCELPHLLVLGYSNDIATSYVGLPGEKARGGYESGPAGAGTDECGAILIDAAVKLLGRLVEAQPGGWT